MMADQTTPIYDEWPDMTSPSALSGESTTTGKGHLSTAAPTDPPATIDTDYLYRVFFIYAAPVVIVAGTLGNILTLVVVQSRFFRSAPSSFLLSALAVADTGVLNTGLLRHFIKALTDHKVDLRSYSEVGCKIHYYLTYYCPHLSAWSLVLMTVERLVSVTYPLKAKQLCSRRRMVVTWVVLAVCLAALNAPAFKVLHMFTFSRFDPATNTSVEYLRYCTYGMDYKEWGLKIWPWIDLIVLSLIPVIVIFASNIIIVLQVVRASRFRQGPPAAAGTGADDNNAKGEASNAKTQTQSITVMLISISVCFLLLTTPISIYFAGIAYWPADTPQRRADNWLAYAICNLLYYVNSALNFVLYCLTGARFRHAVMAVFCCSQKKRSAESVYSNSHTMSTTGRATSVTSVTKTTKM